MGRFSLRRLAGTLGEDILRLSFVDFSIAAVLNAKRLVFVQVSSAKKPLGY